MEEVFLKKFFHRYPHVLEEIPSFTQIYDKDELIAEKFNSTVAEKSFIQHSEILAIQEANSIKTYFENATLLTTLEPCIMCAGAIIKSRIQTVIYFVEATKYEGISSLQPEFIYNLNFFPKIIYNKNAKIQEIFKSFFLAKR
ncbi:MAG: nucleoside deaminase [Leptospiraceae bacterium]|nr:nucleoside deaminase [Leptospiraceae bacterium]MCK6381493.1 nucleoside deaminase [Leptospiraceae bacterium]NUM41736.1 nucleoside deaminase [Leptospiraceae bacterium]